MKNIGLVGLGFIGKTHLQAYHQLDKCQVKAICTRKKVEDEAITDLFSGAFVMEYEDLLGDPEIDIIDICLPTFLHEDYIVKAAEAGKHIICEKPLTLTVNSANRIMKAVSEGGVRLFVGHVLRFWPEYKEIKSLCDRGELEDIEIVHAKRLGQVPAWSDWFQHPEKSGGALFDLHIHDIDFAYYLLGEVESVYAVGNQNRFGAWDHVMTTLSFKNGSKAFIEASQRMPNGFPFTMGFRAQTAESALEFNLGAGENIESLEASQFFFYKNQQQLELQPEQSDAFVNELGYFVDCLEQDKENTVVPLKDVLYVLKLLKAIEKSLATGTVVQI